MFAGTEFGVFVTLDGGTNWIEMNGGIPPISFRDLAIQRRENDLVAASFGRSFYVLDDYSALRNINKEQIQEKATLFEPRKAWWYIERSVLDFGDTRGTQGSQLYVASNPDFGAVFTYYLKDEIKSQEKARQENEKDVKGNIPFAGWEALEDEVRENKPFVYLEIKDQKGNIINRVEAKNSAGFNRVTLNLRVGGSGTLLLNGQKQELTAFLAAPDDYTATLNVLEKGKVTRLTEPVKVKIERLGETAIKGSSMEDVVAFWREYETLTREANLLSMQLSNTHKATQNLMVAATKSSLDAKMMERIAALQQQLGDLNTKLNGNPAKRAIGEKTHTTIGNRLFALYRGISTSTYGATPTHKETVRIITTESEEIRKKLNSLKAEVQKIRAEIVAAGGAWVEGLD